MQNILPKITQSHLHHKVVKIEPPQFPGSVGEDLFQGIKLFNARDYDSASSYIKSSITKGLESKFEATANYILGEIALSQSNLSEANAF